MCEGKVRGKELLLQIIKHKADCDRIKDRGCIDCPIRKDFEICHYQETSKKRYELAIKIYIDEHGKDDELMEILLSK